MSAPNRFKKRSRSDRHLRVDKVKKDKSIKKRSRSKNQLQTQTKKLSKDDVDTIKEFKKNIKKGDKVTIRKRSGTTTLNEKEKRQAFRRSRSVNDISLDQLEKKQKDYKKKKPRKSVFSFLKKKKKKSQGFVELVESPDVKTSFIDSDTDTESASGGGEGPSIGIINIAKTRKRKVSWEE